MRAPDGDVDGAPDGVGRIRMRFRDHPDDADDRALLAGVVEERLLALLHRAQVVPGREVADACPLRPVTPFRDLLGPRPLIGLGLQEPMCHGHTVADLAGFVDDRQRGP